MRVVPRPQYGLEELEELWGAVEPRARSSVFQSWLWVGTWLSTLPRARWPELLIFEGAAGEPSGLVLLGRSRRWRRRFVHTRGLHVQETGDPALDVLTVEYNAPLAIAGEEGEVWDALLGHLRTRSGWDELHVSAAEVAHPAASRDGGLTRHLVAETRAWKADLRGKSGIDAYLGGLSSNSRYQIRRALRGYRERGEIVITEARGPAEIEEWWAGMRELHQAYWERRGRPGAFANPYFETFHRELLGRGHEGSAGVVLRVTAGDSVVGYLYNLLHRGVMSSYQSGFAYEDDAKLKPGLVCHLEAIGHALGSGIETYDFLAGDDRYKQSMSARSTEMVSFSLQRRRPQLVLESWLRRARSAMVRARASRRASD
jgi:CelD/BcsL family acetyltransferase involved in cellulose biosynthesis